MSRNCCLMLAVGMLLMAAQSVSGDEIAGVVTSVSGTWFVNSARVNLGQKVPLGAVITAKEPNARYARVVVMLLDFTEVSCICDRLGRCSERLKLPDAVQRLSQPRSLSNQKPTFWQRLVMAINSSTENGIVKTFARGGPQFSDQVVRTLKGGIDLEPVLRDTSSGDFLVSVSRVSIKTGPSLNWVFENRPVHWIGRGPLVLSSSDLSAGLYQITFTQPRGETSAVLGDAWVLALEASRFRSVSAEYEMARRATAGWDRKIRPQSEGVLRAFMADLNSEKH
jgi:hypothetical protein